MKNIIIVLSIFFLPNLVAAKQVINENKTSGVTEKKTTPKRVPIDIGNSSNYIDKIFQAQERDGRASVDVDQEVLKSVAESSKKVSAITNERKRERQRSAAEAPLNIDPVSGAEEKWRILSDHKVSAVSWHREIRVLCKYGVHKDETYTILVLDSGGFQSVTGPRENSLRSAVEFECR